MIKRTLLTLALGFTLNAAETSTTTTFQFMGKGEDKHGNAYQEKKVTISTANYKVENFWNKFSFSGKGQDNMEFSTVSTTGTVRMTMEGTSLCSLYPQLDKDGCSGQKPFFINTSAVPAIDENISLVFNRTVLYSDYNKNDPIAFYPLDIDRNTKFYQAQKVNNEKSFFTLLRDLFRSFFGKGTSTSVTTSPLVEDLRQKYMANIVSGIDQDHLLEKGSIVQAKISTPTNNDPVAFLDYSVTATNPGYCKLGFFTFSAGSSLCNFPFFTKTVPPTTTTTDTIMEDTESSIIAFAGTFVGDNIEKYNNKVTEVKITENQNTGFFGRLKCFFFGCPKKQITVIRGNNYSFPNDTGITMTFAVADGNGTKVDDFATFRLLGVRSVVGRAKACKIDKDGSFLSGGDKVVYVTESEIKVCDESGWIRTGCSSPQTSYEGNSIDQWLAWCGAPGNTQPKYKSLFFGGDAYAFSKSIIGFFVSKYSLIDYNNEESQPSLILDLKRIQLTPMDDSVIVRYKLMRVEQ